MKEIFNPFEKLADYNNFVSAEKNDKGLKLKFFEDGGKIVASWHPTRDYSSYKNILHGGIQSLLLDEIGCWTLFIFLKTAGVTQSMKVNYIKPMYVTKGCVQLEAELLEFDESKHIAKVHSKALNSSGILCCEAFIDYFVYPKKLAKRFLQYPDNPDEFLQS